MAGLQWSPSQAWLPKTSSRGSPPLSNFSLVISLRSTMARKLLPWYREAESAHGRVSMLAVLGYTVQVSGVKLEPFLTKYPTSSEDPLLAATQVPLGGWLQIILFVTFVEVWRFQNVISKYGEGVAPGDLGWNVQAPVTTSRPKWFGPTFSAGYSPEEFKLMQ